MIKKNISYSMLYTLKDFRNELESLLFPFFDAVTDTILGYEKCILHMMEFKTIYQYANKYHEEEKKRIEQEIQKLSQKLQQNYSFTEQTPEKEIIHKIDPNNACSCFEYMLFFTSQKQDVVSLFLFHYTETHPYIYQRLITGYKQKKRIQEIIQEHMPLVKDIKQIIISYI